MIDLETWGTKPGSAIRSIGAVMFDPRYAGFGNEFYCNVDLKSQLLVPLKQDPDTVRWWEQQSAEAQGAFEDPTPLSIEDAIHSFNSWYRAARPKYLWSQGSNFDGVLLETIYDRLGKKAPWQFWATRDTRTCYEMAEFNTKTVDRKGTYHNALDDAKHQVRCIYGSYQKMDGKARSMQNLQGSIYKWGQETFEAPNAETLVKRGMKEMKELLEAVEAGQNDLTEECADVAFFLLQIAQSECKDLQAAIKAKFEINLNRKWEKTADGDFQHVEE